MEICREGRNDMTLGTAHGSGRATIKGYWSIQGPQGEGEHGLPPEIVELFKNPAIQQVAVIHATAEGEGSAVYSRFSDDPAFIEPKFIEKDLLTEETVRAWFVSAGFKKPEKMHCLINGYDPDREDHWWLVKIHQGYIEIGWRKRVINIDWSETPLRKVITADDVTKEDTMVHAWSVAKAVEYLTEVRRSLAAV
jgi:hypothetical protein